MKNDNKGFSLIELIVVIAIMAILVGVLAPNVLKYVETSRESADKQVADTVRTAVMTALVDPSVNDGPGAITTAETIAATTGHFNPTTATKFSEVFQQNLGVDPTEAQNSLKSKKYSGGSISVTISATNEVEVFLNGIHSIDGKTYTFSTKEGETSK